MFVGVARLVFQIPGSRSLKDRRRAVKSLKDRLRARLPVSVAEVGDVEAWQVATLGVAVVSNDTRRVDQILAEAAGMARSAPHLVLSDVRTEIVPFGEGGRGLSRGLEDALDEPYWTEREDEDDS